ncbi:hypothetical protein KSK55_05980 [Methanospirillum purgamenti]|uniref:Uncharacterized protein n=1 Tax=Methanospirillum hungatei TaxID=2203 RepID=A0A8F5VN96_METHU|nr:hypothetical protein [Methanospirillum hungatei]QXO95929.1 hypothetical protein KSK55_05980 [Methanospirillum hungatei]
MVELSDSTRRLVIFVAIVLGGSILLIFDIPVLYLMMGVIGIAVILLIITGTIILSELIHNLRQWLKSRPKKPKKEKSAKEKGKAPGEGIFSSLSDKFKLPSISLPAIKLPSRSEKPRNEKKKGTEEKKGKAKKSTTKTEKTPDPSGGTDEESDAVGNVEKSEDSSFDGDLLDGLDLDDSLDIDAELDSVNPEFDNIRTPFGDSDAMSDLPSDSDVKKMDISTHDEEEEIILDDDQGPDEIDAIYSSTIEIGSDSGDDVISNMEGGDSISTSDLSTYSSSEETPYMYGQDDDDSGGEEQSELSQTKGSGDDDLIASLKADIEDLKKRDDDVLLRDLKDIHVTAEELAEELQEIMSIINRRIKRR